MQLVGKDGQAVTSPSKEGRYQLDQEKRGKGDEKQGLGGEK